MEDRPSRPSGLIEIAIEPKTKSDQEPLIAAVARLSVLDPALVVSTDAESGQFILSGLSERHLAQNIKALRDVYRVDARIGAPQIAYRETISVPATVDYTHKKQTGGSGEFARVKIAFEPLSPGSGFVFESAALEAAVPVNFVSGVKEGLLRQKDSGLVVGFPLDDMKATLVDGAYHDHDSSGLSFEIAARAAMAKGPRMREAAR